MHCNHEEIIKIVLESESYWMQICVRTFVFCSCTRDNKNICLFCTRMICFEEGCGNILDELDEKLLSEILHDLIIDQEKKEVYEALKYLHLSFNCSIAKSKVNPHNKWYRRANFLNMFYLDANHLLIIHNHILTIAIRIS